ncbi:unnamed protein product [Mytilus coruscus]|uniref:Tyr recombinase domain-containing protein n=1 Tax=Mytilus coruscus TaxID=42192 RepID=A0A6J8EHZ1_MYTCO|nr:unnamed protein product [Mytilus coruscus]
MFRRSTTKRAAPPQRYNKAPSAAKKVIAPRSSVRSLQHLSESIVNGDDRNSSCLINTPVSCFSMPGVNTTHMPGTHTAVSVPTTTAPPVFSTPTPDTTGPHSCIQDQDIKDQLWVKGHTPVKVPVLEKYLTNYYNRHDAELLFTGFRDGFRLNYVGPTLSVWSKNLISAEMHKNETKMKLAKERTLGKIVGVLPSVCSSQFETKLFTAAFSLAFHGLFRVGELTVGSKGIAVHTVLFNNVKVCDKLIQVYLATSKTDQLGTGKVLTISSQYNVKICPVIALSSYFMVRPSVQGPLFCHYDTKQLTRYQFSAVLKKSLAVLGYKGSNYKSHSFRIGMATTLSIEGYADDYIKALGRWKSDSSYLEYIRIPV